MSIRVSPLERIRADIDDLFASERELGEVLEDVARLGVRLLMQTAIEAEVTEFLGRERYAHSERTREGSRNGHCPTTIKTTTGPVTIDRPKLRGTDEAFASRLLGVGVCRTNALESLVIAGFVRGLSVRDVEATLAEALGAEAALSKSTVSRVCEAIKDEFDTWKKRELSDVHLEYLFLDGSHFKFHDSAWAGFLEGMVARGLRAPLLVISDGAPGLLAAVELVFSHSLHQRCLIHRSRNVLAKVPVEHQGEVKAAFWKIFDDIDAPAGERALAVARGRGDEFTKTYQKRFPAAVECLMTNFESLTTYLRFPAGHWLRIRHSNFIERTFGETRRRVKVIGRLPGERSCLGLVWAVLDRASRGWRGVVMTPAAVRHLEELRRQLLTPQPDEEVMPEDEVTVTPAA